MKTQRMVVLTHELIQAGASDNGGWNRIQLKLLGVKWPPIKGWKVKLVLDQVQITEVAYARFLALRGRSRKSPPLNGFFARTPPSRPATAPPVGQASRARRPTCFMCDDPARPESSYCEVCWENLVAKTKAKKKSKTK